MITSKFLSLIKFARKLKPEELECFIDYLSDPAIEQMCECIYNVINTDLKLPRRKVGQLKKHIKTKCNSKRLKCISNKKVPIFKRRKALKQEGRGLGLLLASAIPFLTSLFSK